VKTSPFSEQLYSCREVARQLGTSDDTVRRMIAGGMLDGIRVGRRCLCVPASAISRYLQAREPAHRLVISGEAKVSCLKAGQEQSTHTDAAEVERPVAAPCPHQWNVVSTVLKTCHYWFGVTTAGLTASLHVPTPTNGTEHSTLRPGPTAGHTTTASR